ncbi:MAG: hypothetical protein ACLQDM_27710 [Bradyrhizobium sp.]
MRGSATAIYSLLFLFLAGCGMWNSISDYADNSLFRTQLAFGSAGFVDRCIDIMRRADPSSKLEITNKRIDFGITVTIVDIQATRKDVPPGGKIPRDVAAQCRFDSGVIVDFHWTVGPLE